MDQAERQRQAEEAAQQFASRVVAVILGHPPGVMATWCTSATIFEATDGRVALLTAKHTFDEIEPPHPFQVGVLEYGQPPLADAIESIVRFPGECDVAIAWLQPVAAEKLRHRACPHDCIPLGGVSPVPGDGILLSGFPLKLGLAAVPPPGETVAYQFMGNILYGTEYRGLYEDGKQMFEWSEAVTSREPGLMAAHGIKKGEVFELPHPGGISGGAAWKFERLPGEVWSPGKSARLIGVPCSWIEIRSVQLAEPADRWVPWLREQLGILRATGT